MSIYVNVLLGGCSLHTYYWLYFHAFKNVIVCYIYDKL